MTYKVMVTIEFDPQATSEKMHKVREEHQKALQSIHTTLRDTHALVGWSIKHQIAFSGKEFNDV